ncbi:MAG: hypothetical protein J3R72DRAFT_445419 [Linnemannia gamsii]|nr:MAG: hypothetical protein J3R72DRAFT_445419 [Linnemannia gamsii]
MLFLEVFVLAADTAAVVFVGVVVATERVRVAAGWADRWAVGGAIGGITAGMLVIPVLDRALRLEAVVLAVEVLPPVEVACVESESL